MAVSKKHHTQSTDTKSEATTKEIDQRLHEILILKSLPPRHSFGSSRTPPQNVTSQKNVCVGGYILNDLIECWMYNLFASALSF